jgi:UDP-glucuronate 4-epimerase
MACSSASYSRVLVTGGAGFIGAVVSRRLIDAGHDVVIVDKGTDARNDRARRSLPEACWITADLLTLDLVGFLDGVDCVVHLAGHPGVQASWGTGFEQHLSANTLLTQRLLEAALVAGPRRVVLASSSSVYGDIVDATASEDQPVRPLSPYGVSKAAVEQLMGAYVARGVEAVALRLFTVYGRGQRPDMALARIIDAALGGPAFALRGTGRQARDFTHVDDIAAAIDSALFRPIPAGTICNVGAGKPVPLRTLIEIVEWLIRRPVPTVRVAAADGDPVRTAADPARAHALLDWSPAVDLQDGIADQISHQIAALLGTRSLDVSESALLAAGDVRVGSRS